MGSEQASPAAQPAERKSGSGNAATTAPNSPGTPQTETAKGTPSDKATPKRKSSAAKPSPASPAAATARASPKLPTSLTAEPTLPVKAKEAKIRKGVKENWYDDMNSFLDAPEVEQPKASKKTSQAKSSKKQAAPAAEEKEEQCEEAAAGEDEEEDMPPPIAVHDNVVLYGYEQKQHAEEEQSPPTPTEKVKGKSKKKAAHAGEHRRQADEPQPEPEPEVIQAAAEPEEPPAPAPVSKKTLKVVLKLLYSLIEEAVRTGEVNRIIQLAEEAEEADEKFLLDGDDWQEAARRQAGAIQDSELSGLMSGVRLPNKRHGQDDDDDVLAPRPEEDFRHLQQQQQQQQGHKVQPRGPRVHNDAGIEAPGMARYALRNLGIV